MRAIVLAVSPAAAPYRASGLVLWHETDLSRCPQFGRYRGESGHGGCERRLPSLTQGDIQRGRVESLLLCVRVR